jgi:uncharacterized repeat protein (TIGR01451 family)
MTAHKQKPLEGEIVSGNEEKNALAPIASNAKTTAGRSGVFIGTLNIMAEPARNFITEPIAAHYKNNYHKKYKRPKHVFAFDAFLVALGAVIGALALYFSFFYSPYKPVEFNLSILPKIPASGSEMIVKTEIKNMSDAPIVPEIAFRLPSSVSVKRANAPYDRATNVMKFEPLPPGESRTASLIVILSGTIGAKEKILAKMKYTEITGGKVSELAANAAFTIGRSSLSSAFELPEKIIVGQEFSGQIRYANKGAKDIDNVYATAEWPEEFYLTSSEPKEKNGKIWLGKIKAGTEGIINWSGVLQKNAGVFGLVIAADERGETTELARASSETTVIDHGVSLFLTGPTQASLGETIDYKINFKNAGTADFTEAKLSVHSSDGIAAETTNLAISPINAGSTESFSLKIRIPNHLPDGIAAKKDPTIGFYVRLNGKANNENIVINSRAWNIKVASRLGITAEARYYSEDGDQIGRGPLPPKVGATTRYWIFLNIINTTSAVNGGGVTARLPENVQFTGKVSVISGDRPYYNAANRTLNWNIGTIAPFSGLGTGSPSGAAFEVALTPVLGDAGKYPILIEDIKIFGEDDFTDAKLNATAPDVTARLTKDVKAAEAKPVQI